MSDFLFSCKLGVSKSTENLGKQTDVLKAIQKLIVGALKDESLMGVMHALEVEENGRAFVRVLFWSDEHLNAFFVGNNYGWDALVELVREEEYMVMDELVYF